MHFVNVVFFLPDFQPKGRMELTLKFLFNISLHFVFLLLSLRKKLQPSTEKRGSMGRCFQFTAFFCSSFSLGFWFRGSTPFSHTTSSMQSVVIVVTSISRFNLSSHNFIPNRNPFHCSVSFFFIVFLLPLLQIMTTKDMGMDFVFDLMHFNAKIRSSIGTDKWNLHAIIWGEFIIPYMLK